MKILVTGATGFLGGAAARHLERTGHEVVGTGRSLAAGERLAEDGVRFVPCRLESHEEVERLFDSLDAPDAVVHCAALARTWASDAEFTAANVHATRHVVDQCIRQGSRLVHVSTPSLYFAGRDIRNVSEEAPLPTPRSAYARTKMAAEHFVDRSAARGLTAITLRPRALYGPGDTTILPRLIRALERRRLPIIGRGDNVVDVTYIGNAVQSVERALLAPSALSGRKFNVSDGTPIPLWTFVGKIAEKLGLAPPRRRLAVPLALCGAGILESFHHVFRPNVEPLLTRDTVRLMARSVTLDISAARRDLGYAPVVALEEGIDRFVDWWRSGAR